MRTLSGRWILTFDIEADWEKAENKLITPKELSVILVKRIIEELLPKVKEELDENISSELQSIVDEFSILAESEEVSTEEFDYVWEMLYDWADTDKRCWIKTF